jgi:hypothetical protein
VTDRETGLAGGSLQARSGDEVGTSVHSNNATNGHAQAETLEKRGQP